MFEQFPSVRAAYELVKTVGFDWETVDEKGQVQRFTMRIDVVRMMSSGELAPVVWQVADVVADALLLHTRPDKTNIRGKTVEEVCEAVVRWLDESSHGAGAGEGTNGSGT